MWRPCRDNRYGDPCYFRYVISATETFTGLFYTLLTELSYMSRDKECWPFNLDERIVGIIITVASLLTLFSICTILFTNLKSIRNRTGIRLAKSLCGANGIYYQRGVSKVPASPLKWAGRATYYFYLSEQAFLILLASRLSAA